VPNIRYCTVIVAGQRSLKGTVISGGITRYPSQRGNPNGPANDVLIPHLLPYAPRTFLVNAGRGKSAHGLPQQC
jgi:hypothetical protein